MENLTKWPTSDATVIHKGNKTQVLIPKTYRDRFITQSKSTDLQQFGEGDNLCEISFVDELPQNTQSRR